MKRRWFVSALRLDHGPLWQILPAALGIVMKDKDPAKIRRVTEVLLKMVKLDANAHENAYRGSSAA
jgi:predicted 3-demethylubiquinone-9 3-methyltransferase (glyoxalase superfamily)